MEQQACNVPLPPSPGGVSGTGPKPPLPDGASDVQEPPAAPPSGIGARLLSIAMESPPQRRHR